MQYKLIKTIESGIMLGSDSKDYRVASNSIPETMYQNVSLSYFHSDTLFLHFNQPLHCQQTCFFRLTACLSAFYIQLVMILVYVVSIQQVQCCDLSIIILYCDIISDRCMSGVNDDIAQYWRRLCQSFECQRVNSLVLLA